MKLVNISSKIVMVGTLIMMPDDEKNVSKEIAETPSVKTFLEKGILRLDSEMPKERPVEPPKDEKQEGAKDEKQEEPKKTSGRKKADANKSEE